MFADAIFMRFISDHGDEETLLRLHRFRLSIARVMIDASHESFAENVAITKRVVDRAHKKESVLRPSSASSGGDEEDIKSDEGRASLTNPGRSGRIR